MYLKYVYTFYSDKLANLFMRMPRDMNRGEQSGSHTVYRYVIVLELQRHKSDINEYEYIKVWCI